MNQYFPWGFAPDSRNPLANDVLDNMSQRMSWLNEVHQQSGLDGHIFAAALLDFADNLDPNAYTDSVWDFLRAEIGVADLVQIVQTLASRHTNVPARLEFPNAVALVDCRFVSTHEWEFLRRYSIGGSEVAAVVGKSRYSTKRKLYLEKTGNMIEQKDSDRRFIFDYGHAVEDYVVDLVCAEIGAVRVPEFRMFAHKDCPWVSCNPDAILMRPDGTLALFEAKTATRFKADDWKAGIPDYYAPQPQQYLEVLNDPRLEDGYIGVVFGGLSSDCIIHHYTRDRDMAQVQVDAIRTFWTDYMESGTLPPLTGNADLDFDAVYGEKVKITQTVKKLPDSLLPLAEEYLKAKKERLAINKQLGNSLKAKEELLYQEIVGKYHVGDEPLYIEEPGGITYRLRRKKPNGETVDLSMIPEPEQKRLLAVERGRKPEAGYTNPKLKELKA